MKKMREWISHAKIRTKMLLSYMVIVLTAVITVCFLMYFYMLRIYRAQLLYSADQAFEQAEEFLSYRVNSVLYVSDLLRVNENVQTILGKPREDVEGDIIGQNTDMITLENYIYSICNSIDIYQISLYVPDYLIYSSQDVMFRNLAGFEETEEYGRLGEAKEAGVWLPPQELYSADTNKTVEVISFLQNIRNTSRMYETIGVQRISIRSSDIATIMEKANITTSGLVWIENGRGELISCSNEKLFEEMKGLGENLDVAKEWESREVDGETYYVRGQTVSKTDWTLMAALPNRELFQASSAMLKPLLAAVCILVIAAAVMAVWFSKMITSRISRLAAQMESVEDAIPHLKAGEGGADDEIGRLFESFRYMSNRLEELMDREYENGKAVKHAELKALQAQINPHFLYNTLDLINWEALDCGADRIVKISRALAKFYKLSLNKGEEFTSIRDELDHVGYYIMIQNFRYDNRIELRIDVPEELMDYEMLHIVLQPLAENSFVHGMKGRTENSVLMLRISGYEEDGDIVLEVTDNGCGMPEEEMSRILSEDAKEGKGYGVRNIHTRIRLVYGEGYGLEYRKSEWGGVSVRLRFPKGRRDMG